MFKYELLNEMVISENKGQFVNPAIGAEAGDDVTVVGTTTHYVSKSRTETYTLSYDKNFIYLNDKPVHTVCKDGPSEAKAFMRGMLLLYGLGTVVMDSTFWDHA